MMRMSVSAPKQQTPERETTGRSGYPLRIWWLGASGLCVILGSLGTWEKTGLLGATLERSSGVERHGRVALIAGGAALAAAVLFAHTSRRPRPLWPLAVCAGAAVLGAGAAVYSWATIESNDDFLGPSPGWGIYLTWVASVSLFLASAVSLGRDTSARAWFEAFGARHRLASDALRWTGFALLGVDVVMLFALGQGLIATGPETETLGQGFTGMLLITGAVFLVLVALMAHWLPRLAGTLLMFIGIPVLIVAAASYGWASECDPSCWVESDRQGELSGPGAAIANSDLLTLTLFLLPPLAGLVIFGAGFLRRQRGEVTTPAEQAASPDPER